MPVPCPYYPPCSPTSNRNLPLPTRLRPTSHPNTSPQQQQLPFPPSITNRSNLMHQYPPPSSSYDTADHQRHTSSQSPYPLHQHSPAALLQHERYSQNFYPTPAPWGIYASSVPDSTQRPYECHEMHRSTPTSMSRHFQTLNPEPSFTGQSRHENGGGTSSQDPIFSGHDSNRSRPSPSPSTHTSLQRRRHPCHQALVDYDGGTGASIKVVLQKQTGDITSIFEGDNQRLMIYEGFGYDVQLSWKPWSPLQSAGKGIYARIYYAVVGRNGLMYDLYPAKWFHWQERSSSTDHYPTWSRCYTYVLDLSKVSPLGSSSRGEPRADDLRPTAGHPTIANPPYYTLEFGTADSYEDAAATVSNSKIPVIHREFMVHSKRTAYHHRKKRKHGDQTADEASHSKGTGDSSVALFID